MKLKMLKRFDKFLNPDDKGIMYADSKGSFSDLSGVLVCNIAVDTIRQLYTGVVDRQVFNVLKSFTVSDSPILDREMLQASSSRLFNNVQLPCEHMKLSRMGKGSGFRLKLQNNEVGVVILIGSYWSPVEESYAHLKIELSPHFIASRSPAEIQKFMDKAASLFLESPEPSGVAVHQCVDLQGFTPSIDMDQKIVTKSRSIRSYVGMSELHFEGLDALIMKYNCAETVTVGKSTGLQLSVYLKHLEMVKRDNVDYYHDLWGRFTQGEYDPEKGVTRIEMRFHHTVIKQFGLGIKKELNSYLQVFDYLNNLWVYALKTHRFHSDPSHIHAVWQMLLEDISFNESLIDQDEFKRCFKRPQKNDTDAIKRNIAMLMGNLLSIHSRNSRPFADIQKDIENSPAIMAPLRAYFQQNCINESIYFQHLKQKILERRVASKFGMAV